MFYFLNPVESDVSICSYIYFSFDGLSVVSYLLFLPQHHLDSVHRHHNADLLLLDVLGLEFILRKTENKQQMRTAE